MVSKTKPEVVKKPEIAKTPEAPKVLRKITEIEWEKPCGLIVRTNTTEASIEAAINLKWKQVEK